MPYSGVDSRRRGEATTWPLHAPAGWAQVALHLSSHVILPPSYIGHMSYFHFTNGGAEYSEKPLVHMTIQSDGNTGESHGRVLEPSFLPRTMYCAKLPWAPVSFDCTMSVSFSIYVLFQLWCFQCLPRQPLPWHCMSMTASFQAGKETPRHGQRN